jgi:hypothetical protein
MPEIHETNGVGWVKPTFPKMPRADPRIEAVAKLLFTGPIWGYSVERWDDPNFMATRGMCLMAAEDVLRGIDEVAEWEYGVDSPPGAIGRYTPADMPLGRWMVEHEGAEIKVRRRTRVRPGAWESLP